MSITDSMMATFRPNLEGRMKLEHDLRIHFLELTSGLPAGSPLAGSQNNKSRSDLDRIFAQGGFFNEMKAPRDPQQWQDCNEHNSALSHQ
ncbi:hypothetical protein PG996_007930 [Apiospora saccharicola]|uniref:Uncharacterized protein n=1 Tax=Apiospora saccharicola TaxID=335842 RepID=A0ABR1UWG4_9PEZI